MTYNHQAGHKFFSLLALLEWKLLHVKTLVIPRILAHLFQTQTQRFIKYCMYTLSLQNLLLWQQKAGATESVG